MEVGGGTQSQQTVNHRLYQENQLSDGALADEEIHHVLSNKRRRMLLELLLKNDGQMDARDISERIAELESGTTPAPRKQRQSVYVSLQQTHLPKLDDLGIVDFNDQSKEVVIREDIEGISKYLTNSEDPELPWTSIYLILSVIGLISLGGYVISLPPLSWIPQPLWFGAILSLIFVVSTYQVYQNRLS